MNDQNTDAAKKAAELKEEKMHPIFEECEVMNAGKPVCEYMLSMNGMYISGITEEQLKEMHEKLTELLTGEKPAKYYYGEGSVPAMDGTVLFRKDFTVKTDGDKFPLIDALTNLREYFAATESVKGIDSKNVHIINCFEISKEDYEVFSKYREK
nr:MAG TPA: hypothetical protein [Caudoviricetes sp.]